ncbi:MAG: methyltransferase family protein, partial [Vicinamibacteria bacterium]
MNTFPWEYWLLGGIASLLGISLLILNSWWSPAVRKNGKTAHWLVGFGVNGIGMLSIGAGWFFLASLPPKLHWPALFWIGLACATAGGGLYLASATRVGRLRGPSTYSNDLDVSGIYSVVRHPQALALSLLAVGLGGLSRSIPYLVLVPAWILGWYVYSWLEEKLELVPVFGARYLDYSRETARMFPSPRGIAVMI